jgi:dTMP kinase
LTTKTSLYEPAIREHLRKLALSGSHAFEHIDLVLSYALGLQATYGGDFDVISAATFLHDLGRSDPQYRGDDSTIQSVERASSLLEDIKFPSEKIPQVLTAIAEHDKPSLRPSTLEGRILKDADFLAGFGAVGIARSAMWTGETGGSMDDLIERLDRKMPARLASLEFEQSRYHALQEYVFVKLFIDKLMSRSPLTPLPPVPYVVIEGISGSGKSIQTEMLNNHFRNVGYLPVTLHEPTTWYSQMRSTLDASQRDNFTKLQLLLTDRYLNVRKVIQDALAQDNPVISDRSYLSSMVYQAGEGWLSAANIAYLHTILPQPTHIFLLDTTAQEAMHRIEVRTKAKNFPLGEHETLEQLTLHRRRFLALVDFFPYMHVIDTQIQGPDTVHKRIWAILTHQEV